MNNKKCHQIDHASCLIVHQQIKGRAFTGTEWNRIKSNAIGISLVLRELISQIHRRTLSRTLRQMVAWSVPTQSLLETLRTEANILWTQQDHSTLPILSNGVLFTVISYHFMLSRVLINVMSQLPPYTICFLGWTIAHTKNKLCILRGVQSGHSAVLTHGYVLLCCLVSSVWVVSSICAISLMYVFLTLGSDMVLTIPQWEWLDTITPSNRRIRFLPAYPYQSFTGISLSRWIKYIIRKFIP